VHKLTQIVRTSFACPSQWEAKTSDGHGVYVRFRWGILSIEVSDEPTEKDFGDDEGHWTQVFRYKDDNEWNGDMSLEELKAHTAEIFDWSECLDLGDDVRFWIVEV
jgi:hypothetical protein